MHRWRDRRAAAAVLAPALLVTVVSAVDLGRQPLWYDEIATVSAARRSIPHLFALLGHTDAVLGPYYLLMHAWTAVGTGPEWVRLPSVAAAAATVALTAWLGVRLRGPATGAVAGVVLALNPFFVFYARDARPYTLVALAAVASAHLLVDAPRQASTRRRGAWVVAAVAAACCQLLAALAVGVQLLARLDRQAWRRWLVPAATAAALAAPLAWVALRERGELGWVHRATPWTYVDAAASLAGTGMRGGLTAVLVVAAVTLGRRRAQTWWLLAWLVVPPLLLVTVSLVQPLYVARYTITSLPALALLTALGVVELARVAAPRWRATTVTAAGSAVLITGCLGAAAVGTEQDRPYIYEDMPAAVDLVLDGDHVGDGIVYLSGTVRMSADYYLPRVDPTAPRPLDLLLARRPSIGATGTFGGLDAPAVTALAALARHDRIWVMGWRHGHEGRLDHQVLTVLGADYRPVESRSFGQAVVSLWQRDGVTTRA